MFLMFPVLCFAFVIACDHSSCPVGGSVVCPVVDVVILLVGILCWLSVGLALALLCILQDV